MAKAKQEEKIEELQRSANDWRNQKWWETLHREEPRHVVGMTIGDSGVFPGVQFNATVPRSASYLASSIVQKNRQ